MIFLENILGITEHNTEIVQTYLRTTQLMHCFLNRYSYCILYKISETGGLVYIWKHDSDHKITYNTLKYGISTCQLVCVTEQFLSIYLSIYPLTTDDIN